MIITIDGPSGSGKSTLSTMLSKKLGFFCLNSGYLYRGIAYMLQHYYGYDKSMLHNPKIEDITEALGQKKFLYAYENEQVRVTFDSNDITTYLKHPDVSAAAAMIAQNGQVQDIIRAYKRDIVAGQDAVAEGRDCGSLVFPNADLKLYVVASDQVRAERAQKYQASRGNHMTVEEALDLIIKRDQIDMARKTNPLIQPKDAIVLDTTDMTVDQMVQKAIDLVDKIQE